MAVVSWNESPSLCTALLDNQPVCTLKLKDIGGWTTSWLGGRMWPPPAHLPKAMPQETRFFPAKDDAKSAVEQALSG